jgi:hypothetical protein
MLMGSLFDELTCLLSKTYFKREFGPLHDPATKQISLSLVVIDTTTDLLLQAMTDIALHPDDLLDPSVKM